MSVRMGTRIQLGNVYFGIWKDPDRLDGLHEVTEEATRGFFGCSTREASHAVRIERP